MNSACAEVLSCGQNARTAQRRRPTVWGPGFGGHIVCGQDKKKDTLQSVSFFLSAAAQSCIHPSEIPMRGIGLRAVAARMSRDGGRRNAHGSDSLLLLDYIDLMLKLGQADCAVGTVPR